MQSPARFFIIHFSRRGARYRVPFGTRPSRGFMPRDQGGSLPLGAIYSRMPASETARLEALSDGVFAIAITLLVLEIRLPGGAVDHGGLRQQLFALWPSYVAYVVSFATIGIMWMNHHAFFRVLRTVDGHFTAM